jgi:hemolysin-activating ACP:hemolysin acyltransferase
MIFFDHNFLKWAYTSEENQENYISESSKPQEPKRVGLKQNVQWQIETHRS